MISSRLRVKCPTFFFHVQCLWQNGGPAGKRDGESVGWRNIIFKISQSKMNFINQLIHPFAVF